MESIVIITDDPVMKTRTTIHQDGEGFQIHNTQNVEDVLRLNRELYNSHDERARCAANGEHVASIPMQIYMDLVKSGIAHDEDELRRWLDDKDQLAFRTHPTRLSKRSVR